MEHQMEGIDSAMERRAQALHGQPNQDDTPEELRGFLEKMKSRIELLRDGGDVLLPSWENISQDPRWVHLSIPGVSVPVSFHLLDDGELVVHSSRHLDWNRIGWLRFSAAQAFALDTLRERRVIRRDERLRLNDQVFTPESFRVGYGGEGREVVSQPDLAWARWSKFLLGSALTVSLGSLALFGLEDTLIYAFLACSFAMAVLMVSTPILLVWGVIYEFRAMRRDDWEGKIMGSMSEEELWEAYCTCFLPHAMVDDEAQRLIEREQRNAESSDLLAQHKKNNHSEKKYQF